jgi:hypothetical protein
MCDQLGLVSSAETRAIVGFAESAPKFGDEFRRPARQRANFRACLPVTYGPRPVGYMNRDSVRGALALRAVARLTIHGGARTIEDDFEAQIGVHNAALRAREACEDTFAFAAQVLDRFEQVAAPDQVSRI